MPSTTEKPKIPNTTPGKSNGPAALFVGVCLTVLHLLVFLIYNVKNIGKSKKKEEYEPLYDKLKRD